MLRIDLKNYRAPAARRDWPKAAIILALIVLAHTAIFWVDRL